MLQLPPDSVSGGYAGGFDLDSMGSHRQLSTIGWLYTGSGDNFNAPSSIWTEGTSGSNHFYVSLGIAASGDPSNEPCILAELNLAATGAVLLQQRSPAGSITVPHRYCIAATVDMDTQILKMYLGDEATPMAEVTTFAAGYPVTSLLLPYPTFGLGQRPFIDVQNSGFGQAYDKCLMMGSVMTLGELIDWQFYPRNLAGSLGFFDPIAQGIVPTAGGFKSQDGKALNAASDISAPEPTNWGVLGDATYHRLQAGALG